MAPGPGRPGDETTFCLSRNRLLRGGAEDAARGLSLSLFSRRGPRSSAFLSRRWALAACILWGCWQPVPLIPRAAVLFGRASPCASSWAHREGGADAGGDRYPDVDSHGRDNSTPRRILAKCWHQLRNVLHRCRFTCGVLCPTLGRHRAPGAECAWHGVYVWARG